jgi:large subunit ribosomal protein L15
MGMTEVNLVVLKQIGAVGELAKVVKVINTGAITKAVKLSGIGATAGAKAAIEAAGGSIS